MLSLNMWQLVLDADLCSEELPIAQVNSIMAQACEPCGKIMERRARVAQGVRAEGIWTFAVPPQSPFRVRCRAQHVQNRCAALVKMTVTDRLRVLPVLNPHTHVYKC